MSSRFLLEREGERGERPLEPFADGRGGDAFVLGDVFDREVAPEEAGDEEAQLLGQGEDGSPQAVAGGGAAELFVGGGGGVEGGGLVLLFQGDETAGPAQVI